MKLVSIALSVVMIIAMGGCGGRASVQRSPEPTPASRGLVYPRALLGTGVYGKVVAQVYVDAAGNVTQVKILESPHELFSDEVVAKARKWRFNPEPAGFIGEFTFEFRER